MRGPVDLLLVVGGRYHDFDFVRLELLKDLSGHPRVRTRLVEDWPGPEAIAAADAFVSYTCDRIPDAAATDALAERIAAGRRWFALHGTNALIRFRADGLVECPPLPRELFDLLGSRFLAHPPIGPFEVRPATADPLTDGIGAFAVVDEPYLQETADGIEVLLSARIGGPAPGFVEAAHEIAERPVMYRRAVGAGAVLHLALGHARGRYDMRPLAPVWPRIERCAWTTAAFRRLVRRGLDWAIAPAARDPGCLSRRA